MIYPFMSPLYEIEERSEKTTIRETIIQNIASLIKELPLENVHEQFYVFCYLLWNGYFSVDKKYEYKNIGIKDESNTIFMGYGCCRHNAELLDLTFKRLNIEGISLPVGLKKLKFKEQPMIKRKLSSTSDTTRVIGDYLIHNHRIYIGPFNSEDNSIFLFDPTNITECEILYGKRLHSLNSKYTVNKVLFDVDLDLYHKFNYKYNIRPSISKKELREFYLFAKEICEQYHSLFDDFFIENKQHYEEIQSLILK